jgi:ACT domain-containing protein
MLTLFIVVIVALNNARLDAIEQNEELKAKIAKADEINDATRELDIYYSEYYNYIPKYKKHKLGINVNFRYNSSSMDNISRQKKDSLIKAGGILQDFIKKTIMNNPQIQYLLIIEGQASKDAYMHNYELIRIFLLTESIQRVIILCRISEKRRDRIELQSIHRR